MTVRTAAEYDHTDYIGHRVAVSAELALTIGASEADLVVIGTLNEVYVDVAGRGQPHPEIVLTAAGARDLAASLILAANALEAQVTQ